MKSTRSLFAYTLTALFLAGSLYAAPIAELPEPAKIAESILKSDLTQTGTQTQLLESYSKYLEEEVLGKLPADDSEIENQFEAYKKGESDLPIRRQTDDTGMIGRWTAGHELHSTAMSVKRALKKLNHPHAAVIELRKNVYKDAVGLSVSDWANPDKKHFETMIRQLAIRIAVTQFRIQLALEVLNEEFNAPKEMNGVEFYQDLQNR